MQLTTTGTLKGGLQGQIFVKGEQSNDIRPYYRFNIDNAFGSNSVTASFAASSIKEDEA